MKYSSVAEAIPDSMIRSMMVRASEIPDVISFAVGEPDFAPPQAAIDATKAALDRHDTKYAPGAGVTELREVYADYIAKMTGVPYTAENIVVTAGGMASLFLGLMCMLDTDDEVLVSAPYFCNYHQMIAMCHGVTVPVDVYEKDDFILTPEAVEKALTPKTKVLMLNSPCNPTGGVISLDALKALAKLAIKHDLFVISDEVYRHILFDDAEYHSIASLPGMAERTLIVDSCSKTFSMTGFRVGFGAGPEHLTFLMTKLTEASTPTPLPSASMAPLRPSSRRWITVRRCGRNSSAAGTISFPDSTPCPASTVFPRRAHSTYSPMWSAPVFLRRIFRISCWSRPMLP